MHCQISIYKVYILCVQYLYQTECEVHVGVWHFLHFSICLLSEYKFLLLFSPCQPTRRGCKILESSSSGCHPHTILVQRLVLDVGEISSLICAKSHHQMAIDFSMILIRILMLKCLAVGLQLCLKFGCGNEFGKRFYDNVINIWNIGD